MAFNLEKALAVGFKVIESRKPSRQNAYALYYSNDQQDQNPRKITGFTIKQLIEEFRGKGTGARYAIITPINNPDKYLRLYDSARRKGFYSVTQKVSKSN